MKAIISHTMFVVCLVLVLPVLESYSQGVDVRTLQWSPDTSLLAISSNDGIDFYNDDLELVQSVLEGVSIYSIDWHPSRSELAISYYGVIEIWKANEYGILELISLIHVENYPLAVLWNSDGSRLAYLKAEDMVESGSQSFSTLVVLNATSWNVISETDAQYRVPDGLAPYILSWNPINPFKIAVIGGQVFDNVNGLFLYIIDSETGMVIDSFDYHDVDFSSVSWDPLGTTILAGGYTVVSVIDVVTGQDVAGYQYMGVKNQQWRTDGKYMLLDNAIFAEGNPYPIEVLNDVRVATWHPTNSTLTVIIDGVPVEYSLADVPGYIPMNLSPQAAAGADQTITADASDTARVTLDGTGSTDSDGTIVSYVWTEDGAEIATGATAEVRLGVGTHTLTLTVTDDDGASASDAVVVFVIGETAR